jgi:hypothetical protein
VEGRCKLAPCLGQEICADHLDNDCDGKFDERNADEAELCGDKLDNDCDTAIDERPNLNINEICGNGDDDDCDGLMDEGHDQDEDGMAWCGDTGTVGGGDEVDCDDYDPDVRPGRVELCDGRDNDCDSRVDETTTRPLCEAGLECVSQRCVKPDCTVLGSSAECPAGLMCNAETKSCVARGCDEDSCSDGQFCDETSGECRTTRRDNGEVCVAHGDCASGSCIDQGALRLRSEAARVCGQACCSDADCPTQERCYVSGSGARSCLPSELAPRPQGALTQCTDRNHCGLFDACSVVEGQPLGPPAMERDDLVAPACRIPPPNAAPVGNFCNAHEGCASGTCVPGSGWLLALRVCSRVCSTSQDCLELTNNNPAIDGRSYCRFVERENSGDFLPVCILDRGETGRGGYGATCSSNGDCLDGACVGAVGERRGICSTACCRDSDCPALPGGLAHCRPVAFGEHYEMRCVP